MDELIEENMGLVVTIVDKFGPKNYTEREDLIDAGRIGLWKALKNYNKESGLISTYAWRPIRWSIIREIKNKRNFCNIDNISPPLVENSDYVWECYMDDMNDKEKELIELRIQGYKFNEICNIVGEEPTKVKSRFYKLIKRLREVNAK